MSNIDVESIEVERTSHVTIRYADGVTGTYLNGELRLACPCAECNEKRQRGVSVQPSVESGTPVNVESAELAGAYGLSLDWADGHRTGIYTWEFLRRHLDRGTLGAIDTSDTSDTSDSA